MNAGSSTIQSEDPALSLGRVIARHRDEIEERWLERVERDVARGLNVELTHLRDGLPDYLATLVDLLLSGQSAGQLPTEAGGAAAWAAVAREHGITRVRIGFDIAQLVHEFIVL